MKRAKHPGGRPPLPPEERKSEALQVRVTPGEADALYRQAIRRGQSLSEFLRGYLQGLSGASQAR